MRERARIALTIAGSDSGGGAGIQADLKSFSANGVYGASVITALTAQNTLGVQGIHNIPADFIAAQMDSVFSDLCVDAVKIGMLSVVEVIAAVATGLKRHSAKNIVLDPVMVATSGDRLLSAGAMQSLVRQLFPLARLITPNLAEASALLGVEIARNEAEMVDQGRALLAMGASAVLVKGGHLGDTNVGGAESVDVLVQSSGVRRFAAPRIDTRNTHGTGCTLSAAIAANLAKGADLAGAIEAAKTYVAEAIAAADRLQIGHGYGPTHHFHHWW